MFKMDKTPILSVKEIMEAREETRPVNVYKVELLVIDHDDIGEDQVRSVIENNHYPNHCMSPKVEKIEARKIEWKDSHPLNNRFTQDQAYRELFEGGQSV